MAASHEQNYFDLVCEGGGVKGIGLSGAYSVLEEQGYVARSCAGTSAGAITAALIAAGYDSAKLREVIFGLDYLEFEDATWEDKIPLLGKGLSIAIENGMYKGDEFEDWIRGLLADRGVHTFADLRAEPGDDDSDGDDGFKSCLQVIASDLTARQMLVLPRDARDGLGIEPEELEVAKAVRMSMSIPVFFEPVRWSNPRTKREHLIVDGGVLSNFPLWMFDRKDDQPPRWPTFGLLLVEPDPTQPITEPVAEPEHGARGPRGLIVMLRSLVETMLQAHDRMYIEKDQYARTIPIPTCGVGTTEFDIKNKPDKMNALYDAGRTAATHFLATWNFSDYVKAFRDPQAAARSRRTDVLAEQEAAHPAQPLAQRV
jgi:NTE family protein